MNLLKRELAPIVEPAWEQIDDEARAVLTSHLAGRRVVDVDGPHGWSLAAINTGGLTPIEVDGEVDWSLREVQPIAELRVPFQLSIANLDLAARGSETIDLAPVVAAATAIARDEDRALLEGIEPAGIGGMVASSPHDPVVIKGDDDYPRAVIDAVGALRRSGISGPFAVVLGAEMHDEMFAALINGYPLSQQVKRLVDGPIVRAPSFASGAVVSIRGGDYTMSLGRDHSIGYSHRDREVVHLFLTESFTFRVIEPAAAIALHR